MINDKETALLERVVRLETQMAEVSRVHARFDELFGDLSKRMDVFQKETREELTGLKLSIQKTLGMGVGALAVIQILIQLGIKWT